LLPLSNSACELGSDRFGNVFVSLCGVLGCSPIFKGEAKQALVGLLRVIERRIILGMAERGCNLSQRVYGLPLTVGKRFEQSVLKFLFGVLKLNFFGFVKTISAPLEQKSEMRKMFGSSQR
jgi:hypothetical protein